MFFLKADSDFPFGPALWISLRWTKPSAPLPPAFPAGVAARVARAARRAGFSRVVFRAGRSKCGLGLQAARVASSARRHGARGHGAPRGFLNRFNNPARRAASPFAFPFRPQKMHTSRGSGVAGRCHAQRAPNGCLAARTGFRLQLDTISGSSASCCRAA